jgi:hypothetical protein
MHLCLALSTTFVAESMEQGSLTGLSLIEHNSKGGPYPVLGVSGKQSRSIPTLDESTIDRVFIEGIRDYIVEYTPPIWSSSEKEEAYRTSLAGLVTVPELFTDLIYRAGNLYHNNDTVGKSKYETHVINQLNQVRRENQGLTGQAVFALIQGATAAKSVTFGSDGGSALVSTLSSTVKSHTENGSISPLGMYFLAGYFLQLRVF